MKRREQFLTLVAASVYDALEDMGLDAHDASRLIEGTASESWRDAVYDGMNSYMRKLRLNGGKPKPPTI